MFSLCRHVIIAISMPSLVGTDIAGELGGIEVAIISVFRFVV